MLYIGRKPALPLREKSRLLEGRSGRPFLTRFRLCVVLSEGGFSSGGHLDPLRVIVVPGSEQLSAVLNMEPAEDDEEERERESLLGRFLAHF